MHHCKPTSIETELFIMVNHDIAKPLKKLMKSLNYQTLLVLIMPLIMVGCGNKSQPIEYEDIAGVKMAFEDGFNGSACVLIYDDTLAFWSYDPGHRFEIAHIKGDSVLNITSMCTIGQGPNEYLDAALFKNQANELHILAGMSTGQRCIQRVPSISQPDSIVLTVIDSFCHNLHWGYSSIVPVSPDTIILIGGTYENPRHIFSMIDLKKRSLIPLDYWPDDGFNGADIPKHLVYSDNAKLYTNHKGKYAYCMGVDRFAFIFSLNDTTVNIEKQLYDHPVKYVQASDELNYNYLPEAEGMELYATDSAIYVLLMDKDVRGEKARTFAESRNGNEVIKYDWNGNIMKAYRLDHVGVNFIVNDTDSELFLQSMNSDTGELELYRYPI